MDAKRSSVVDKSQPSLELVSVSTEQEPEEKPLKDKYFSTVGTEVWAAWDSSVEHYEQLGPTRDEGGFEIFGLSRAAGVAALLKYAEEGEPSLAGFDQYMKDNYPKLDFISDRERPKFENEYKKYKKERAARIRSLAAPEIRRAFLEDKFPGKMRDAKYQALQQEYKKAHQEFDALVLKKIQAEFKGEEDQVSNISLSELMVHLYNANKNDEYKELLAAKRAQVATEKALKQYCQSPAVVRGYLENHYQKGEGRLQHLHDESGRPEYSMLDAMAQHCLDYLYVFSEDSSVDVGVVMPRHEFRPEGSLEGHVRVFHGQTLSPATLVSDQSNPRYHLLKPIKPQPKETPPKVTPPQVTTYKLVSVDREKEELEAWYFHEFLNLVLVARSPDRPQYVNLFRAMLGPNSATFSALQDRKKRRQTYDIARKEAVYGFYSKVMDVVHRRMRELHQNKVFEGYKQYIESTSAKEIGEHEKTVESCQAKLNELQGDIFALPGYAKLNSALIADEKARAQLQDKDPLAAGLDFLIGDKKQQLIKLNKHYDQECSLMQSLEDAKRKLKECQEKWQQEADEYERIKKCLTDLLPHFTLEYSKEKAEWIASVDYRSAIEDHENQKMIQSNTDLTLEVKAGNKAGNKKAVAVAGEVERIRLAREKAKEMAGIWLDRFAAYEKQCGIYMDDLTASTSADLKAVVQSTVDKEFNNIIAHGVEKIKSTLGYKTMDDSAKEKKTIAALALHLTDHLKEMRRRFTDSSEWEKLGTSYNLKKWVKEFRQKLRESQDACVHVNQVVEEADEQYEQNASAIVTQYKTQAVKWLDTVPSEAFEFFLHKKINNTEEREEAYAAVIEVGLSLGSFLQVHFRDPETGDTLLHWIHRSLMVRPLHSQRKREQYHLYEMMKALFSSGADIHAVNLAGDRACDFTKLELGEFEYVWEVLAVYLETVQTASEYVDELRSDLVGYANYNHQMVTGSWDEIPFTMFFKRPFVDLKIIRNRLPDVAELVQAIGLATDTLDDSRIITILEKIIDKKHWEQSTRGASWLRLIAKKQDLMFKNNQVCVLGDVSQVKRLRDVVTESDSLKKEVLLLREELARLKGEPRHHGRTLSVDIPKMHLDDRDARKVSSASGHLLHFGSRRVAPSGDVSDPVTPTNAVGSTAQANLSLTLSANHRVGPHRTTSRSVPVTPKSAPSLRQPCNGVDVLSRGLNIAVDMQPQDGAEQEVKLSPVEEGRESSGTTPGTGVGKCNLWKEANNMQRSSRPDVIPEGEAQECLTLTQT